MPRRGPKNNFLKPPKTLGNVIFTLASNINNSMNS
jgi:hypothetical protein